MPDNLNEYQKVSLTPKDALQVATDILQQLEKIALTGEAEAVFLFVLPSRLFPKPSVTAVEGIEEEDILGEGIEEEFEDDIPPCPTIIKCGHDIPPNCPQPICP